MTMKLPFALPGRTVLSRLRGFFLCSLYCICSVCVSFAALEGILSVFSPPPHTTIRPMFFTNVTGDYEPSIEVVDESVPGMPYSIKTNDEGFRMLRSIAKTKPQNTRRVLCLGDSFTFGVGVETVQTYPEQLWHLLKRQAPDEDIEVINAGVPMFDIIDEMDYWREKGRLLHPDVVVLQFFSNDISDLARPWPWRMTLRAAAEKFSMPTRLANSALFRLAFMVREAVAGTNDIYNPYTHPLSDSVRNAVMATPLAASLLTPTPEEKALMEDRVAFHEGFESWELERFWATYRTLLTQFKNEIEATGAKFLLVVIPYHEQIYNHPLANVQQTQLEGFAQDMGVSILNMTPIFRFWSKKHPSLPLYNLSHSDMHCSPAGNGVIASSVANQLRSLLHPSFEHQGRTGIPGIAPVNTSSN